MYDKCILFTEDEQLFEKVSFNRALEIINNEEVTVLEWVISHNSYGEFLFIYIRYQDTVMCMYGLGEHVYRERWVEDFTIDGSELRYFSYVVEPKNKEDVIKQMQERAKMKKRYEDIVQTDKGRIYEHLADIGDEDGAAVIIDDCYSYFEEESE